MRNQSTTGNRLSGELLLAAGLVVVAMATRVLFNKLGIFNFNAVMATAFFAGAYLARGGKGYLSIAVPMIAMLATDAFLGFYTAGIMITVYGALLLTIGYGRMYSQKPTLLRYVLSVLAGSTTFFVLTNAAVWLFGDGTMYPHTFAGLVQSYTMAIPFWRNTLTGDMLFSAVLFGSFELMKLRSMSTISRAAGIASSAPEPIRVKA